MNNIINNKANTARISKSCIKVMLFKRGLSSPIYCLTLIASLILGGCKKYIELGTPPDKITQENVFSSDRSATTVLTDICVVMSRAGADMAEYGGLLADEWTLWSGAATSYRAYFTNAFEAKQTINTGTEIWNAYYNYIFRCNSALEGIINNENLTLSVQKQLLGEAYFLRAYFYFYLLNLYGDLPLAVGTDPEINRLLTRSAVQMVYNLIEQDLLQAQGLLSRDFLNGQLMPYPTGAAERVRPSYWAATALLARIYLYTEKWEKAIAEADKLIGNIELFALTPLSKVFLKNSGEAIWQVQPVDVGWNTQDARRFHLGAAPSGLSSTKRVHLSQYIKSAFEPEDERRKQWIDSLITGGNVYYFPIKYKVAIQDPTITTSAALKEYSMVLRLGEQYLIRAEARARQNNLLGSIADLDTIRSRARLPLISNINPGISQKELLDVIFHERYVELFSEWGHRWFDLKRLKKVDELMNIIAPAKGGTWESTDELLPIPYNDLLRNPKLIQNTGY